MKKILKIFLYVLSGMIGLLLLLILLLFINSPGKTSPFRDGEGKVLPRSLAVIESLDINGVQQKMILRSADTLNPVLLYLHGGPGSPEYPYLKYFGTAMEDHFTVCYWDQRGSGMSYYENIPPETMTLEQFIEDAAAVSRYLITRFGQDKIYLMGHSWGTMLGSYTVNRYPTMYKAYFAIGQVVEQLRAEQISYDFVLENARENNDTKAIQEIETLGRPPYLPEEQSIDKVITERKYVTRYRGAIRSGNFYTKAMKAIFRYHEYTIADKINYFKGMGFSMEHLWPEVMQTNFFEQLPAQQVPVYMFQGKYDYQTSYAVAREYFDSLKAPEKRFFTFENSAHSPNFEEAARFDSILISLVRED